MKEQRLELWSLLAFLLFSFFILGTWNPCWELGPPPSSTREEVEAWRSPSAVSSSVVGVDGGDRFGLTVDGSNSCSSFADRGDLGNLLTVDRHRRLSTIVDC